MYNEDINVLYHQEATMKLAKTSEREPGVNEITQINYQAGEQIRQMLQQQQKSDNKPTQQLK